MDNRDIIFDRLIKLETKYKDIVIITCDMNAWKLEEFKKKFPSNYYNVGPAEQGAVLLAAGLAIGGFYPFVYGITAFIVQRAFEQIKLYMNDMSLPITLLSYGIDDTYWYDGPTHRCHFDKELIGLLSNITIYNAEDIDKVYQDRKPAYVRIAKNA